MIPKLEQHFKRLQEKLLLFQKKYQALEKENLELKKKLEKHQTTIQENNAVIVQLQQQIDALKLQATGLSTEEKIVLEKRINGYLIEIEKCLALLNA